MITLAELPLETLLQHDRHVVQNMAFRLFVCIVIIKTWMTAEELI